MAMDNSPVLEMTFPSRPPFFSEISSHLDDFWSTQHGWKMFPPFHICQQKTNSGRSPILDTLQKKTCLVGRLVTAIVDTPCLVGTQFNPLRNQGLAETSGRHAGSGLLLLILPGCLGMSDAMAIFMGIFKGNLRNDQSDLSESTIGNLWSLEVFPRFLECLAGKES